MKFGRNSTTEKSDEFQTFTGVAQTSYELILSRARKYALGLILSHQQTGQLSNELLREILGNVTTLICFNVSHDDAAKLSQEYVIDMGSEVITLPDSELQTLQIGEAWGKIDKTVFKMTTPLAPQKPDMARAKAVIERSRQNYGLKPAPRRAVPEPLSIQPEREEPKVQPKPQAPHEPKVQPKPQTQPQPVDGRKRDFDPSRIF